MGDKTYTTDSATIADTASSFLALWNSADRAQRSSGRDWYAEARSEARAMARDHSCSLATACGVIAALSPRLHWSRNLTVARVCLAGETPSGVFQANLTKAEAIRGGARPLRTLSGPKVRAFYRALMGGNAPVVDIWVARAAAITGSLTERMYALVASALVEAARLARTTVARLQATIWVVVRGRAG